MVSDIITALGILEFTVDGADVKAYYLDGLQQRIDTAKLPARVIRLQLDAINPEQIAFLTCKQSAIMDTDWTLGDLLLIAPVGQGTGLSDFEPLLTQYASDYIIKMQTEFNQPTNDSELISVNILFGMFEYPLGAGEFYHGIQSTLVIRQHLI